MITAKFMNAVQITDAELVGETLSGNRDAFSQIVVRYQSLVCALAYSATGNLGQSEDLAQETFITAWKHLSHLRERDKLRSWLGGIARNHINNFLRREGREPIHQAEPLETAPETQSPESLPVEYIISREEQAILWHTLERIPQIYREPLVLFYRENQSVERVAQALEISEDAVHQRLARGRKMLQEQVLAFVEGALGRTNPGKNFTLSVLAALPLAAASAKAATVGAALAKGGVAAKGVMTAGTLGGFLAMLGGAYITFMAQADDSKSSRERRFILQNFGKRILIGLFFLLGLFAVMTLDFFRAPTHLLYLVAGLGYFVSIYSSVVLPCRIRRRQQIQIEDGTFDEAEWTKARKVTETTAKSAGIDSNDRLKTLKFMALGIGLSVFVVLRESWKQNFGHAVLMTTYMVVAVLWGFLRWNNRPRFQSLRGFVIGVPVFMGLMTLAFFNWRQYLSHLGADATHMMPTGEILTFNLVVTLAYAALIGVLIWKRNSAISAVPQQ
jgi:RNA polymerase sigma factor (sigma-70 family)